MFKNKKAFLIKESLYDKNDLFELSCERCNKVNLIKA